MTDFLNNRYDNLKNLSSLVKISLKSPKGSHTIKQVLVCEKDSFLRIESLNMFGQPVMYFLSENNKIKVYYPDQNTFFYGNGTAKNINKLIGIPLEPSDIIRIITGNIKPLDSNINDKILSAIRKDNDVYLTIQNISERIVIVIDNNKLTLKNVTRYDRKKKEAVEISYDDYEYRDGYLFPLKIYINMPDTDRRLSILYKDVFINKGLPQNIHDIKLPKGVRNINMDTKSY